MSAFGDLVSLFGFVPDWVRARNSASLLPERLAVEVRAFPIVVLRGIGEDRVDAIVAAGAHRAQEVLGSQDLRVAGMACEGCGEKVDVMDAWQQPIGRHLFRGHKTCADKASQEAPLHMFDTSRLASAPHVAGADCAEPPRWLSPEAAYGWRCGYEAGREAARAAR